MDILINVFLPLSLAFIMFSLGLGLTVGDFARVFAQPKAFLTGIVAQVVLLPLVALALLQLFNLPPVLAVGVMILSFCPGGVTSNMITKIAGGNVALSVSLTGIVSLLSVLTVPFLVAWAVNAFMGEAAPPINVTSLAIAMFVITAVPVAIGVAIRHFAPNFAVKAERITTRLAFILFVIIVIAALAATWSTFIENLVKLGPLLMVLNALMIAVGLGVSRLAGLAGGDGKAISVETGIQNATLGITIAGLIAQGGGTLNEFALPSAVYGITMYLVTLPFVAWIRGRRG